MEIVLIALGAAVGVLILGAARSRSRLGDGATTLRTPSERAATYTVFVDVWSSLFLAEPDPTAPPSESQRDELAALDRLVALYASPAALRAHLSVREAVHLARQPTDGIAEFVTAVRLLRSELGSRGDVADADLRRVLSLERLPASTETNLALLSTEAVVQDI